METLQKILSIGALTVGLTGLAGNADGEQIFTQIKDNPIQPIVRIDHRVGATESYGPYDSSFLQSQSTPAIDFFSNVPFDPYRLMTDARPIDSFSTITEEIIGRGLSGSVNGSLKFTIYDLYNDNAFANKNIFADLYNSSHTLLGTYDVKDYAAAGTTIPITVNDGLSYTMDVRFDPIPEPSSALLAATGALAVGAWGLKRYLGRNNNGKDDYADLSNSA